jgi:drug/metabolite transporter (DMT)-like permease
MSAAQPPASAAPARRPGSVTFVAVLTYINGIANIVGGVLLLFTRESMARESGGSVAGITTSAVIALLLGVVTLIVARGLLDGSRVSRAIVTLVMIVNLVNGVLLLFTLQFVSGAIDVLWTVLLLALLYTRRANAFFDRRRP